MGWEPVPATECVPGDVIGGHRYGMEVVPIGTGEEDGGMGIATSADTAPAGAVAVVSEDISKLDKQQLQSFIAPPNHDGLIHRPDKEKKEANTKLRGGWDREGGCE